MSLSIQSFDVNERSLTRKFVQAPWQIYIDDPVWVPPLIKERMDHLSPNHPYFEHATARFWVAQLHGKIIGRISAQVDELKPAGEQEQVGYFGMFECIDDAEVAMQLFKHTEEWLGQHRCALVRGPFNLSINQESGLLVEGFNTAPQLMMGHARPYYQRLLTDNEYYKAKDLYAWCIETEFVSPPAMQHVVNRYEKRIKLRDVSKKTLQKDVKIMMHIFNNAWENNWGFIPFTAHEFEHLGKQMLQLIPADHFKIAELDGEPVGIIAGLPNFNEIIKDLNGRLFPFGIVKLLWRLKFSWPKTGRVALLGIKQEYQNQLLGSALAFMLIAKIKEVALKYGVTANEISWVLEDNDRLNKILQSLGARRYKTYRVYEKRLGYV